MKRLASFVALLAMLLPNLVLAQTQPALVTLIQPSQPSSGQALPGGTVAAVAVTISSNTLVNVTGIKVQKVGSANNAAIASLQVNTDQATVVGRASSFDANNAVTIPVTATTTGSKIFLVSAVMASNLTPYAGQSFELNITGVTTDAVSQNGTLPVYGAQFLISTGVAKPTCSISASSGTFQVGQTINVSWKSSNATGGTITGIGNVGPSGLQGILPGGQSQTLVGTFTGPGGTATCSLTLTLTSATGGTVQSTSGGVDTTGGVQSPSGPFGSTDGGTQTPGTGAGSTGGVSVPGGAKPASNIIPCSGLDCRPCDLAALAQNIINYMVGLTIPLAAVMFAWAGILYFTSATNERNIDRAKAVFRVVLWGFLIVIGSYIAIQLLLRTIMGPDYYKSWNVIQCTAETSRPGIILSDGTNTTTNVGQFFGSLGSINTSAPSGYLSTSGSSDGSGTTGSSGTCPSGSSYSSAIGGCVDTATGECTYSNCGVNSNSYVNQNFPSAANGNSGAGTAQWASALSGYCNTEGLDGDECRLARAIMANESSGRSGVISSAGCVGLMQVCPATACGLDPSVSGCTSDGRVANSSAVTQALLDPGTNMRLGTELIGNLSEKCNGDEACIAASYNGGFGSTRSSKTCIGQTVWECSANPGYQETRVYVPRVLSTYNRL